MYRSSYPLVPFSPLDNPVDILPRPARSIQDGPNCVYDLVKLTRVLLFLPLERHENLYAFRFLRAYSTVLVAIHICRVQFA